MSQPPPPYDAGGQGQPYEPAPQQPYQQPAPQQAYPQQQPYQQADPNQPYAGQNYPQQPVYQGYPQQYAGPPARPNNSMAMVSLISGIAGLTVVFFIGSIVAVITGYMARKQIAETGEEGSGLATGGLIMGWIGIALGALGIIAWIVLMAIGMSLGSMSSY